MRCALENVVDAREVLEDGVRRVRELHALAARERPPHVEHLKCRAAGGAGGLTVVEVWRMPRNRRADGGGGVEDAAQQEG